MCDKNNIFSFGNRQIFLFSITSAIKRRVLNEDGNGGIYPIITDRKTPPATHNNKKAKNK